MLTLSYPDEALAAARRATATATTEELQEALRLVCLALVSTDHRDEAQEFHEARLDALRAGGQSEQADSEERRGMARYDVGSEENVRGVVAELERGPVAPRLVAELELTYVASRLADHRADGLDTRSDLDARIDRAIAHLETVGDTAGVDRAHPSVPSCPSARVPGTPPSPPSARSSTPTVRSRPNPSRRHRPGDAGGCAARRRQTAVGVRRRRPRDDDLRTAGRASTRQGPPSSRRGRTPTPGTSPEPSHVSGSRSTRPRRPASPRGSAGRSSPACSS